ncbi:hypothetical protein [Gallaecimonas pentaromativorans]|uniref:hypothetical protein n=1 Tax=Gallaecimonas pentaromativorans TaxID=584787 RepID=UPI0011CD63D8|nr:hypothetical protein [Gallaecimonas pentaromativorans]
MKFFFAFLIFISFSSLADTRCDGKISDLAIGHGGVVLVTIPEQFSAVYICSVVDKQNGVDPEACRAMYSTLLAAKAAEKSVSITFLPAISSCSMNKSWAWAQNINWIFLKN